MDDRLLNLQLV